MDLLSQQIFNSTYFDRDISDLISTYLYEKINNDHESYELINQQKFGKYLEYFPNSRRLKRKIHYRDDKKEGEYFEYYRNRKIKIHCYYKNDLIDDVYEEFYKTGQKKMYCIYKNGVLHGKHILFDKLGKLKQYVHYINGLKEGEQIKYDSELKSKTVSYCKLDKLHGKTKIFKHKILIAEIDYVNGVVDGLFIRYYENGNIELICQYESDQLVQSTEYHENGNLREKIFPKTGYRALYYDNGQMKFLKTPREHIEYFQDGRIKCKIECTEK